MPEDDIEKRSFSAAVFESVFEQMRESPYITIANHHAMGSMPEQDIYVSFTVEPKDDRSAVGEDE